VIVIQPHSPGGQFCQPLSGKLKYAGRHCIAPMVNILRHSVSPTKLCPTIPSVNFINILRTPFLYERLFASHVLVKKALLYKNTHVKR